MQRCGLILGLALLSGGAATAGPLTGKSYIIELTSSQYDSGYGDYLVPPLARALDRAGLRQKGGPGADIVANIQTRQDNGAWKVVAGEQVWMHRVEVMVGLSGGAYVIPPDGTAEFSVTADLVTPNPDREDELDCLIGLAARTAIANYRARGHLRTDGTSCLRGD